MAKVATSAQWRLFCYTPAMKLSEILRERGYVYQYSSGTLEEITDGDVRTVYLGVDPTADSIHVGNLAVYMLLRRFADTGHRVILLIGGGTGMIGDPKPDVERPLLSAEEISYRSGKLKAQAERLLGGIEITLVNNHDWLGKLHLIEFLRETGKYFTVNALVKKDAISARMESEDGISFTEFSYPLLQAHDFWHLNKTEGCDVQIGGSDQWGNIVAGTELIRRKENRTAYALTIPIITDKATGKKFGKSEGNAVWLDPEKTSPFAFYQFWLNASDESVEDYLKLFTLLSLEEISLAMEMHGRNPGARHAQQLLAREVTKLVHGEDAAHDSESVSQVLFGSAGIAQLDERGAHALKRNAPNYATQEGENIVDILVASNLASSKREARQFLSDRAVTLNGEEIGESYVVESSVFRHGVAIVKRGKRNVCVLTLA